MPIRSALINFDSRIYSGDEVFGAHITHGATHDAEGSAEQSHVTKVKGSLEEPIHSAKKENKIRIDGIDTINLTNNPHKKNVYT